MPVHQFLLLEVAETEVVFPDGRSWPWQVAAYRNGVTAVAVLGHLPRSGQLVMIENYRPSLGNWSLEVAGGLPEPGEALVHTARREFQEETGFVVDTLIRGPTLCSLPGIGNFPVACFIAQASRREPQTLDAHECVRVVIFPATAKSIQDQKSRVFEPVSFVLLDQFLRNQFNNVASDRAKC